MAEYVNPTKNVRKKTCFRVKTGLFTHPFGGDKRDRTADLLNAIQALSRLDRLHTPLNRANRAFNTRDTPPKSRQIRWIHS